MCSSNNTLIYKDNVIEFIRATRYLFKEETKSWNKNIIGWEHQLTRSCPEEIRGTIAPKDARSLLEKDVVKILKVIQNSVTTPLNKNQIISIASLIYDIGIVAFKYSTLKDYLDSGNLEEAYNEFRIWSKFQHKVVYRLARVRKLEMDLFIKSVL